MGGSPSRKDLQVRLQTQGLEYVTYCFEGCGFGTALAADDAWSGIALATADASSVAAADACPGIALAAASASCLRLNHSQIAIPIAPTKKSTAPSTLDQLRLMLCLAMLGCGSQTPDRESGQAKWAFDPSVNLGYPPL